MKTLYPRWFGARRLAYEALDSDDEEEDDITYHNHPTKPVPPPPTESPRSVAEVRKVSNPIKLTHRDELDLFSETNLHRHWANGNPSWPEPQNNLDQNKIDAYDQMDNDDDDGDDTSTGSQDMMYMTQYYVKERRKTQITVCPPSPRNLGTPYELGHCSKSFETQETQLEESSETSNSSFASSLEEDEKRLHNTRFVRWLDHETSQPIATVHSLDSYEPSTCRVVILLHMNNGQNAPPDANFEFLHCEFLYQERVKVHDVLAQIGHLTKTTKSFIALYHQGKELINAFALQDYHLEDGVSILVALREGPENRNLLLAQSGVLLSDRMLRQEIRKARIAGRSLQTLHSSTEWQGMRRKDSGKDSSTHELGGDQFMFVA